MVNFSFQEIWTTVILFLPRLGIAILIFLFFWLLARILRGAVQRFGMTKRLSPDIINLMEQITEVGLLIFGAVISLGTLGIDVRAMIAGLGLAGFALGFALKDLLSNFLAGFLILIYNPFVRGDHITVAGNEGQVIEINLRYTVLQDTGRRILIPNANLFRTLWWSISAHQNAFPGVMRASSLKLFYQLKYLRLFSAQNTQKLQIPHCIRTVVLL